MDDRVVITVPNKTFWLAGFVIVLICELVSLQWHLVSLHFISKPLIVPMVAGYFISCTSSKKDPVRKWILLALFFSWIGDILLMFDDRGEIWFLLGLSSFLVAHIFYMIFFHTIRVREKIKSNIWFLGIIVVYYAGLIILLSPYLGDKKLPVRVYGIVISFMFLLALHMVYAKNKKAGMWMMTGALLFVISDSLLAINKFYQPFAAAGLLVISTYALAQLFIAHGAQRNAQ